MKISPFDAADYLENDEEIREFLALALREGTAAEFLHALDTAARAKRRLGLAKEIGGGENDFNADNPPFDTVMKATKALGFSLEVGPAR